MRPLGRGLGVAVALPSALSVIVNASSIMAGGNTGKGNFPSKFFGCWRIDGISISCLKNIV